MPAARVRCRRIGYQRIAQAGSFGGCIGIPLIRPTVAESIRRVVGPQFSDLFWPVACGLWDLIFLKAAGGTHVEGVISKAVISFSLARTQIHKYTKDDFSSLRSFCSLAEMENRLFCICFVRKVIF